ncbi:hypothetical protein MPSEU_000203000 [Mayamaea pseudoterrestris]|nr:hypothetical protein MPSEU_000203000 [Mayamaea pseudoterrestris]
MVAPSPGGKNQSSGQTWYHPVTLLLLVLVLIQWALISFLLTTTRQGHGLMQAADSLQVQQQQIALAMTHEIEATESTQGTSSWKNNGNNATVSYKGVVATVIFKAPKWFHLRYTLMLHNALANMPLDWHLQIFVNVPWARDNLWSWHPGLKRLVKDNPTRVTLIPLPDRLVTHSMKPKMVVFDEWFWQSMLADNVLLISGNGAFCGNHMYASNASSSMSDDTIWSRLPSFDYMGAPSLQHYGQGGDASVLSFRNRNAMLQVLQYAKQTDIEMAQQGPDFFLTQMLHMNDKGLANFRVASREDTEHFAGTRNLVNETGVIRVPLVVAGTQEKLSWEERDSLLKHCPELRMIFPSMHEPACFGAHPKPEVCKATICALQDHLPGHGC